MNELTIFTAFVAGLVSFFSPCCLPLYPSYISYLTGLKHAEIRAEQIEIKTRLLILSHSFVFLGGLSLVFLTIGLGAGALGAWFYEYRDWIRQIAALVMVFMSLVMLGWIRFSWLQKEWKWQWTTRPAGFLGSLLIGMGFAAGWSPCIGPILGSILSLSAASEGQWLLLISVYIIGFSLPFLALGWWVGRVNQFSKWSAHLTKIGAILLLISAVLLYTDQLTEWTIWYTKVAPDWLKFG